MKILSFSFKQKVFFQYLKKTITDVVKIEFSGVFSDLMWSSLTWYNFICLMRFLLVHVICYKCFF